VLQGVLSQLLVHVQPNGVLDRLWHHVVVKAAFGVAHLGGVVRNAPVGLLVEVAANFVCLGHLPLLGVVHIVLVHLLQLFIAVNHLLVVGVKC